MRVFALLATLALGCGFLAEAAPLNTPTPQVDEALGEGWSRVTHPDAAPSARQPANPSIALRD